MFNLIKRPPYVDSSVVNLKVLKVDSILINQRYRKRITFESFAYGVRPVWVEGVGDYNYGLIDEYGYIINNAGLGGSSKILCFNEGLIQIVGNCKIENAGTVSELVKELDMGTKFEVYPTIFDNTINIDSDLPKEFNRIHLINSKGAIVFKGDFKELVNYSFENLQDGIYTIVIFGGESSLVKRIVKKKW